MPKNEKKRFLLRINAELFESLERWAAQELRSANGQIEYLLHEAVSKAGRGPTAREKRDHREGKKRSER